MHYHEIKKDDCLDGEGVRVTLFVSGCDFHCEDCQNSQTWNSNSGIPFTKEDIKELFEELSKDYVQGLTLLGGEPLHDDNLLTIENLINNFKDYFPQKDIWLYTGYTWEEILRDNDRLRIVSKCDVIVEGRYIKKLKDNNYHWAGSTNQRVINVTKTLKEGKIILYE